MGHEGSNGDGFVWGGDFGAVSGLGLTSGLTVGVVSGMAKDHFVLLVIVRESGWFLQMNVIISGFKRQLLWNQHKGKGCPAGDTAAWTCALEK